MRAAAGSKSQENRNDPYCQNEINTPRGFFRGTQRAAQSELRDGPKSRKHGDRPWRGGTGNGALLVPRGPSWTKPRTKGQVWYRLGLIEAKLLTPQRAHTTGQGRALWVKTLWPKGAHLPPELTHCLGQPGGRGGGATRRGGNPNTEPPHSAQAPGVWASGRRPWSPRQVGLSDSGEVEERPSAKTTERDPRN